MDDIDALKIQTQDDILNRIKSQIMDLEDGNLKRIDGVDKFSEAKMVNRIIGIVEKEIRG